MAASKCRMRKIEKIQTLDHQTSELKSENDELAGLAAKLKEQVRLLDITASNNTLSLSLAGVQAAAGATVAY